MRLQKFLSAAGVCSRRRGEELIQEGRVQINGVTETRLGTQVDPLTDQVTVNGVPAGLATSLIYVALNKPPGYVTTCCQPGERIIMNLVADLPERVYPIGRLDKDSRGLLLLTNDGRLHHRLAHPSFDHEKEYEVTLAAPLPPEALQKMARGLPLLGRRTRPAKVRVLSGRRIQIVLQEGRNRQVRRMVGQVGGKVVDLKRTRVANIRLNNLPEGRWRYLTATEIAGLGATPLVNLNSGQG